MVNIFLFLSFQVDLEVTLPGEGRDRVFRVAIKWVAQVSLYALEEALEGEIFFQIPKMSKRKRDQDPFMLFFLPYFTRPWAFLSVSTFWIGFCQLNFNQNFSNFFGGES